MSEHFDKLSVALKRHLKVFLCHASADKPKVRELYRTLKRRGVQPWLDAEDLIPGQNWEVEIPKAILSSDAIIICLTPNSVDKEGYVQKEIKFALDKAMEMPEGRIFIIPARLEDCDLPFSLRKYQAVNLYEKAGYTKLMQALKLRASQLERATVELPKAGETTAEIKKVVEEKKPPEPKEEKSETKPPKPSSEKVGVGGDVKDSVIVAGSGNVINFGSQEKPAPEKPQPKKTKLPRKPNTAIIVALIGLAGTIVAALLGSPIIEKWFSPVPSATGLATVTATLTSRPAIPSQTIAPSQIPTQAFTSTPILGLGSTMISEKDGMAMVYVPYGEFTMGGNSGNSDEKPAHQVFLDAFWIDETEITIAKYNQCVQSSACEGITHPNYDLTSSSDQPIIMVNWYDANKYCAWAGRRLPTEAEWEKAARGTDARLYPWGNGVPTSNLVNMKYPDSYDLKIVGSYPDGASPYGALDMAGSVWEWVSDWYENTYYSNSPSSNPMGPLNGTSKVMRGGGQIADGNQSFYQDLVALRSVGRAREDPLTRNVRLGFRCAMDASP